MGLSTRVEGLVREILHELNLTTQPVIGLDIDLDHDGLVQRIEPRLRIARDRLTSARRSRTLHSDSPASTP